MKDRKMKLKQPARPETKANLRQARQGSSSPAKEKKPILRFSPTSWAKLMYFRDKTDNEVSGFGIARPDDLLCVTDFLTVKQEVTGISFKFDDEAVADFFDAQVDLGRKPEQFARIWLHSHPGDSPEPSVIDEETFARVFGNCQWAVMFILAQDNHAYAKLRFNVGPGGDILIPAEVDYSHDFGPSDRESWNAEYLANIKVVDYCSILDNGEDSYTKSDLESCALPHDFINELESMEPAERRFIMDELAGRPDLWGEESEVMF